MICSKRRPLSDSPNPPRIAAYPATRRAASHISWRAEAELARPRAITDHQDNETSALLDGGRVHGILPRNPVVLRLANAHFGAWSCATPEIHLPLVTASREASSEIGENGSIRIVAMNFRNRLQTITSHATLLSSIIGRKGTRLSRVIFHVIFQRDTFSFSLFFFFFGPCASFGRVDRRADPRSGQLLIIRVQKGQKLSADRHLFE